MPDPVDMSKQRLLRCLQLASVDQPTTARMLRDDLPTQLGLTTAACSGHVVGIATYQPQPFNFQRLLERLFTCSVTAGTDYAGWSPSVDQQTESHRQMASRIS